MIGSRQCVSMVQNIFSVHLVVELIKAEFRLVLRLSIQLDLKFPYLTRCCQTHRQSPLLSFFTSKPEVRALPSPGITRLHRYIGPFPTPRWSVLLKDDVRGSRPLDHPGPPPLSPITFLTRRAHY